VKRQDYQKIIGKIQKQRFKNLKEFYSKKKIQTVVIKGLLGD